MLHGVPICDTANTTSAFCPKGSGLANEAPCVGCATGKYRGEVQDGLESRISSKTWLFSSQRVSFHAGKQDKGGK